MKYRFRFKPHIIINASQKVTIKSLKIVLLLEHFLQSLSRDLSIIYNDNYYIGADLLRLYTKKLKDCY